MSNAMISRRISKYSNKRINNAEKATAKLYTKDVMPSAQAMISQIVVTSTKIPSTLPALRRKRSIPKKPLAISR